MDKYIPPKQSIPHAKELILKRIKLEENCIEKPFDTGEIYALQKAALVMDAYETGDLVERRSCNTCKYYEGVHNVQGCAPCSFLNIGCIMWNDFCSRWEKENG